MKAQHTPGPWYAIPNEHYVSIKVGTESHDQNVASVFLNEYIKPEVTMDVATANAKLMQASPELLEALQHVLQSDQFKSMHYELQNEITYVINKATGIEL